MSTPPRPFLQRVSRVLALFVAPASALAQTTLHWRDNGTDFTSAANWLEDVAPTNDTTTNIVSFGIFFLSTGQQPVLSTNRSVAGVEFTNNSFPTANDITLSGTGTLTLGASGITNALASVGTQTISLPLALSTAASFTSDGSSLTIAGAVDNRGFGLTLNGASANGTLSGALSGSGSLTKADSGTWTLTGANTHTGGTVLSAGALQLGSAGALGSSGTITFNGGTLQFSAANTTDYSARFSTANFQQYSIDTNGQTVTLSGDSTYSGGTALSAGTLAVGSDTALGTGTLALNGGALQAAGGARTLANGFSLNADTAFSGGASNPITLNGAGTLTGFKSLTVATGTTARLAGAIGESSPSILIKQGAGTLELTGANTFTGGAFISAGTVRINNTTGSAFGTGAVTVASGATLTGAGSFSGSLTLNGNYSPGNSPGTQDTGSQTWNGGASFLFEINNATGTAGTNWDLLAISGSLTINATSGNLFGIDLASLTLANAAGLATNFNSAADYSFTFVTTTGGITGFSADKFSIDTTGFTNPFSGTWAVAQTNGGNDLALTYTGAAAIPEPSTYAAIFGACALALAAWRRRRRSA